MKSLNIIKATVLFGLFFSIATIDLSGKQESFKNVNQEDAILRDVAQRIKSNLEAKHGKVSSICFTYNLNGVKTLSTTTKVYYDNYRKKPDFEEELFANKKNLQADKIVQVKYNKHSDEVSLNYKSPDNKNHTIYSQTMNISELQIV